MAGRESTLDGAMASMHVGPLVLSLSLVLHGPRAFAEEPAQQPPSAAQPADEAGNDQDLAKKLTNPISDLVSLPFQFNWNGGLGPTNALQVVLNVQPVVPVSLSKDWNLIGRFILPVIAQPELTTGSTPTFGFGDVVFSLFLSPNKQTGFIWGVGPVFGLPMSTNTSLGSGKWEVGPTAVALVLDGPWTIGALVNQLFSFADVSDVSRNTVSQLFAQPFINYTTHDSFTFTVTSESTFNFKASDFDQAATIPVEGLVAKVTRLGTFPFSVQVGGGYFVQSPTGGPNWRLRMNFVVLLPRKK